MNDSPKTSPELDAALSTILKMKPQPDPIGTVRLRIREVYGKTMMYPDNETAELFCKITRTQTMTKQVVQFIRSLGYEILTDRQGFEI